MTPRKKENILTTVFLLKETVCCDNMILWNDVKPRSISHHDNVLGKC